MKSPKAIFVDFDGTLVDETLHIPPKLTNLIKKIQKKKIHFVIATGRPFLGEVEKVAQLFNLNAPQIMLGGAAIIDPKTKKILFKTFLQKKVSESIIDLLQNQDIPFKIETPQMIFFHKIVIPKVENSSLLLLPYKSPLKKTAAKIIIYPTKKCSLNTIASTLEKLNLPIQIIRIKETERVHSLHLTSKNANKFLSVKKVKRILDLQKGYTVGIGDGLNDLDLLKAVDKKVSVDTAPNELISMADTIIPCPKKEGVFHFLKTLI